MSRKGADCALFLSTFFLIFSYLPSEIRANTLFGGFAGQLSVYILMIAAVYSLCVHWREHKALPGIPLAVKLFIAVYGAVLLVSLAWGLYIYPYYDKILAGPANQVEKLPVVYDTLRGMGIAVSKEQLLSLWMFGRPIKGALLEILYTFGFSLMIFSWYRSDWKRGLRLVVWGALAGVTVVLLYSILDIFYLAGNQTAPKLLGTLNPVIHSIEANGTSYPPLLWKGQLRSVFAEPSYFGIYAGFALPWLWYGLTVCRRVKMCFVMGFGIFFFTFCIFMTSARTGTALFFGELFLLAIFAAWNYKIMWKKTAVIFLISLISFLGANIFISDVLTVRTAWQKTGTASSEEIQGLGNTVNKYISDNVTSYGKGQRSNGTRYTFFMTDFRIGVDHPILGVGNGLRSAYYIDYLPKEAYSNREIKFVTDHQKKTGIMRFGMARLGEYTARFAETGIAGLAVFLAPFAYLFRALLRKLRRRNGTEKERLSCVFFTISFIGILASWIGDSMGISYAMWIMLPIGYAMCLDAGKKNTAGD